MLWISTIEVYPQHSQYSIGIVNTLQNIKFLGFAYQHVACKRIKRTFVVGLPCGIVQTGTRRIGKSSSSWRVPTNPGAHSADRQHQPPADFLSRGARRLALTHRGNQRISKCVSQHSRGRAFGPESVGRRRQATLIAMLITHWVSLYGFTVNMSAAYKI
jgi:hypothetical protein